MPPSSAFHARAKTVDRHAAGELHMWGGIVSARLVDYAGALETTPGAVLSALDREGIEPLTDTAQEKGQSRSEGRPTDPTLRSLALTKQDFQAVAGAV